MHSRKSAATTTNITAGLCISKVPATSSKGLCQLAVYNINQPEKADEYLQISRSKKCICRTILTHQYNNIVSGANFNQLTSSCIHPTGILIILYVSSQVSYSFGDFAWKSPFDTAPADGHPISLQIFK